MKYVFMDEHQGTFRVSAMSRVLQVSRSGFYAWRKRRDNPSPRQQRRKQLDTAVKTAFDVGKGRSGSPRLVLDLAEAGHQHDRKTVADSMRRQGLRAKAAKKFKATTNSKHNLPVAPNLLQQDFTATAANQKYVGDITYLWTDEGTSCARRMKIAETMHLNFASAFATLNRNRSACFLRPSP